MKKYLLFFLILSVFKGFAQPNKLHKGMQVNDTSTSYNLKAVINPYIEPIIIETITNSFGDALQANNELVWSNESGYEIVYAKGKLTINFGKSNDNQSIYFQLKNIEDDINYNLNVKPPKPIAISTKDYVLNENFSTYSYKAVFNPHKKNLIYRLFYDQFGEPTKDKLGFKWEEKGTYNIVLNNDRVNITFDKINKDLNLYNNIKKIGEDISELIVQPSPKNVMISNKDYVLNDNAYIYSLKSVLSGNEGKEIYNHFENILGKPHNYSGKSFIWRKDDSYVIDLTYDYLRINLDKTIHNDNDYTFVKSLGDHVIEFAH